VIADEPPTELINGPPVALDDEIKCIGTSSAARVDERCLT
jgi:hypothetical protein